MKINRDKNNKKRMEKCHDGVGSILFREVFSKNDFESNLVHLHETVIEPHSTIGYHKHVGNEEVYYIIEGTGVMKVNEEEFEVSPGDAVNTQSGDSHGLTNSSDSPIKILVFECKY